MTDAPDDPALIALGAAVSDGAPVDWERVERDFGRARTSSAWSAACAMSPRWSARIARSIRLSPARRRRRRRGPGGTSCCSSRSATAPSASSTAAGTRASSARSRSSCCAATPIPRHAPLAEARHLARVRHANVVVVHGADEDDDQAGIWMEYIDGQTLAAMIRDHGVMSAREVVGIGLDLCRALSALHAAGLIHRDIKAHNVMREVGGRIVLMDFSGAQALAPGHDAEVFSGTPLYMAPELFDGAAATPASDVYSLGVLLFFLLTGTVPVDGPTMASLREAHRRGVRKRLRDLRPDLPESIVQIVETRHRAGRRQRGIRPPESWSTR